MTKTIAGLLLFAVSVVAIHGSARAVAQVGEPAMHAAVDAWLLLVDSGHYEQSWAELDAFMRGQVSKKQWVDALRVKRGKLGEVKGRSSLSQKALHGADAREYEHIELAVQFSSRPARETITLVRGTDGSWQVCGYTVQ
ncbi:MAG: DUF4019 domain-containing protein [Vicinamibacterales bacterium]